MKRVLALIIVIFLAIVAGQLTVKYFALPLKQKNSIKSGQYMVTRVLDGDTIEINGGERVRLIGIDTPESHDNAKLARDVKKLGKSRQLLLSMGQSATIFTKKLVEGQMIRLEFDVESRDKYQRVLGYVFLQDGTFVNEKIIQEGYAYPLTIPPNVKYAHIFKQRFKEARDANKGLWRQYD